MTEIACLDIGSMTDGDYRRLFARADAVRQAKAERYLRQEDKNRCVAADGLLRYVLRKNFGVTEFQVAVDALGKPYLPQYPAFHFNLSHSGRFAVMAWGDSPVGVDIQQMDSGRDYALLAQRHYTPQEQEYVFDPTGNRMERFYQVWTAKESYLKYLGTGLRRTLDSFNVLEPLPEVRLESFLLEGHALTLCSRDPLTKITHPGLDDL